MAKGERRLQPAYNNGEKSALMANEIINATIKRYCAESPQPDTPPTDRAFTSWYRQLLITIGQQQLNIKDIQTLDVLFRRVYIPLSIKYGIVPKLIDFSLMVGIDIDTIYRGVEYSNNSTYSNMVNNWLSICKETLIQSMLDSSSSNINHIFIAKAVYGLSDSPKQDNSTTRNTVKTDRQAIIAELNGENVENSENVENFNEQND